MLPRLRRGLERELARPVQGHAARVPFALGLAAMGLLGLAALAGVPLALRYDAAEVPGQLRHGLPALWRSLHAWLASGALALVLVHLARTALTGAYAGPRRRTWLLGLANLAALLALFWLGTALRGDQQGLEAWQHGAEALGLLGWGAPAAAPLGLLFWLHVLALPLALGAAVGLHVLRVRRLDLAPLPGAPAARAPFRTHARAAAQLGLPVAALLALLAVALPWPLGPDPLPQLAAARPPWPFAWLVPLQDALGSAGIWAGLAGLFGALALLPRLDPGPAAGLRARAPALGLLGLLLALLAGMGLWALLGPGAVRIVG